MTDNPPAIATRVDIATDDRLGQRVSALRYAREALTTTAGWSASKIDAPVDDLLKVSNWLLDDTHPDPDPDDEAAARTADPNQYVVIRRPWAWDSAITADDCHTTASALTQALAADHLEIPEHNVATEVLHRVAAALHDAEATEATAAGETNGE